MKVDYYPKNGEKGKKVIYKKPKRVGDATAFCSVSKWIENGTKIKAKKKKKKKKIPNRVAEINWAFCYFFFFSFIFLIDDITYPPCGPNLYL